MSIFAETKCNFSPVSTEVYTALIHQFTCRFEARQALIYQLVLGLTGENGKYNYSRAVHVYPLFFDITCSAKNYKIAPALTSDTIQNRAVFLSPISSNSRSSPSIICRTSAISKGAILAPQLINMLFAVLPVVCCQGLFHHVYKVFTIFCRKWPGTCYSSRPVCVVTRFPSPDGLPHEVTA